MDWLYLIAFTLTFIFSFALGIFTILHNYKSKIHWLWFLTSMGVALWAFGSIASIWFSADKELSLTFFKLLDTAVLFVMIFYLHFVTEFLNLSYKYKLLIITNYFIGLLLILLLNFTQLIVVGVEQRLNFNFWEKGGFLFPVFYIYCILVFLICLNLQIKGFKMNDGLKKRQLVYLIVAIIIGFGGGLTAFLPALLNIYPFGILLVFIYPILITYGIFLKKY